MGDTFQFKHWGSFRLPGFTGGVFTMLLTIGKRFEIELGFTSIFIRIGSFERLYNRLGLPNGSVKH